jgi:hypothetical protein
VLLQIFRGVRLCLQAVFEMRPYLDAWWKAAGHAALTALFAGLTEVYAVAALRPAD